MFSISLIKTKNAFISTFPMYFVNCYFRPTTTYAASVWEYAAVIHMNKLQLTQNKSVCSIFDSPSRVSTTASTCMPTWKLSTFSSLTSPKILANAVQRTVLSTKTWNSLDTSRINHLLSYETLLFSLANLLSIKS